MSDASGIARWPALAGYSVNLALPIVCERGIWGIPPRSPDRQPFWIAATPQFRGRIMDLAQKLYLGSEDQPTSFVLWRSLGGTHHAVHCYPSHADSESTAIEKQVLEWEREPDVPAAVGALALLPAVAAFDDSAWRGRVSEAGHATHSAIELSDADRYRDESDAMGLTLAVRAACRALSAAVDENRLAAVYAGILAGQRAAGISGLARPLDAAALAALLLPLPRELADRFNMLAWLPSREFRVKKLQDGWDVILGGQHEAGAFARGPEPDAEQLRLGARMAAAVLSEDPDLLTVSRSEASSAAPAGGGGGTARAQSPAAAGRAGAQGAPTRLMLWGSQGAGKTVYLARLQLDLAAAGPQAWRVLPEGEQVQRLYERLRQGINQENRFPPPTPVGQKDDFRLILIRVADNKRVSLVFEDRSGEDYLHRVEEVKQRLYEAEGLLLFFDPQVKVPVQEQAIADTLNSIPAERRGADGRYERPVAFCMTKADAFIDSAGAYREATQQPERFVRRHMSKVCPQMLAELDRHCSRRALFPCSAAGIEVRHGAVERSVFFDESGVRRLRRAPSLFMLEPIEWLMNQLSGP
jgi:hypothetical protein